MNRILLVEDDTTLSTRLKESLEKWQFEVFLVEDFLDCMATYHKVNPHLVIMDITLPVYDGYYWCNKIREVSKLPIIFLSSRDSDVDMIMGMRIGGDDFVRKPFSTEVLIAKINAILRRSNNENC